MSNPFLSKLYFKAKTLESELYLLKHKLVTASRKANTLSGFLFTTHKSASSFIPQISRIIQSTSNRVSIDYEIASWHLGDFGYGDDIHDELYSNINSFFNHFNKFYAPLRSPPPLLFTQYFSQNPIMLFLRDPRDLAISAYYSFGFSHPLPTNTESKKLFIKRREWIKSLTIDAFCLEYLRSTIIPIFTDYLHLLHTNNTLYLRYNDYIDDPHKFFTKTLNHFNCSFQVQDLDFLISVSHPVQNTVNHSKHQRSGNLSQYRTVLSVETNSVIVSLYSKILNQFGFDLD